MRLAERPVRFGLASGADAHVCPDPGTGNRQSGARHAGHAANGQTGSWRAAARLRWRLACPFRREIFRNQKIRDGQLGASGLIFI